jgi:cyanophycinase
MPRRTLPGTLLIIGGHEDKEDEKLILRALAERVEKKLVVATVASGDPDAMWEQYEPLFRRLGVRHVWHLDVRAREDAKSDRALRVLEGADAVFFTGGDQLKITSQLGDSPVYQRVLDIYERGGLVAGTSAGASIMSETMLVAGDPNGSPRIGDTVRMAPGLGLFRGAVIDQHFAERGRITRLIGAVAQNPRILGIGIDENTAICVERKQFTVIGEGGVYVADGQDVSYSNLAEEDTGRALSVFGVKLCLLSQGDRFDLETRAATPRPAEEVEKELSRSA